MMVRKRCVKIDWNGQEYRDCGGDDLKPDMGEHIFWVLPRMGAYMGMLHGKGFLKGLQKGKDFKEGKEICYFSIYKHPKVQKRLMARCEVV